MKVVEHDIRSGVCHRGVVGKLLQHEFPDLIRVPDGNVNYEVLCSTEEENLNYLRMISHLSHEFTEIGPCAGAKCHGDKCLQLQTKGLLTSPEEAARQVLAFLNRPDFGQDPIGDVRD